MIIKDNKRVADYWRYDKKKDKVICALCPRNCALKEGQEGFCKVRGNEENKMYTYNYGQSIEATIETIETEAVYHFAPGSRILSMGNVGCMMACSFCQNWQTSQVKHLNPKNVHSYTPEEVIDLALKNNIDIISWTYNDPVVWQEFVVATSKLAQENNIKTLYKSALYIESEPLAELIEIIDIFSISLKSMNDDVYKKVTKGRLQPVLDAILQISKSDCHLEISQLIVTDLNDNDEDARETARWIVSEIGGHIPLHFVAYHPAFRYTKERTSNEKLIRARDIAKEEGVRYCYLGNMYHEDVSNTHCEECNELLVQRFGLTVKNMGLDGDNKCIKCTCESPIIGDVMKQEKLIVVDKVKDYSYTWADEINSVHIIDVDKREETMRFNIVRQPSGEMEYYELNAGIERLIISKSTDEELSVDIVTDSNSDLVILPVLDRAHFPVINESENSGKYLN